MVKLVDQSHASTVAGEAIGFVREMTRFVTAVDGKGIERDLSVGDPVYNNELIQTIGNSLVVLDFIDGTHLNLGKRSKVLLDDEVFNPDFIGDANNMAADVEIIQALILSGIDPAIVTEETAAGVPREAKHKSISNDESVGLRSGIIIDLTGQQTTPESGYETYGLESLYQQPQLELFNFPSNEGNAVVGLTVAVTSFTTNDNTPAITGTVNDSSASVIVVINGNSYAATNNGDGSWTLNDNSIPDLNLGDSPIAVTVTDAEGNTDSSTGVITVINNNPIAGSDSNAAVEDGVPVNGVVPVASDIDGDLDPMSYVLVTDVSEGTLTFNPDGSYSFNPGPDFQDLGVGESRDITFTYTVSDTRGGISTPAVITITVTGTNDVPVVSGPVSDTATENDAAFNVDFLSGATDVDVSDSLAIANLSLAGGDASGVVLVGNSLSVDPSVYKSLAAGETEVITYSYDVVDNQGGVTPQTATITIVGTNDVPVVTDVGIAVVENSADVLLSLPLPTDLDTNDTLTITVTGLPAPGFGAVTLSDGTPLVNGQTLSSLEFQGLQFDTAPNIIGSSSFTYSVTDGSATVTGTATITVSGINNNPVAIDNQYSTDEDSSFSGNVLTDDSGLGIDNDLDGDALSVSAVNGQISVIGTAITLASGATLTMQSDGSFVYDASTSAAFNALPAGSNTTDSFNYTTSDGNGGSDIASVAINITGTDDAPVISTGSGSVVEDTAPSVSGLLSASDADNPGLAFTAETIAGTYGDLVVALDGRWTYTLNSNADALSGGQSASETLSVNLNDGSTTSVAINITGSNDGPVIDLDSNDSTATGSDFVTGYTEGGNSVYIADSDMLIADSDSSVLQGAIITITNSEAGDLLTVGALPAGISASAYDPATGVITLSGTASLVDYQTAIRAIQFGNDGSASGTPRNIAVSVDDGTDSSPVASTTVNMTLVPTISIDNVSVQEPVSGTTILTFTISVDQVLGSDLNFDYQTVDASALAGSDYNALSGLGIITAGSTSTTVTITVNSDADVFEGDETFTLDLTNFDQTVNYEASASTITGGVQGTGNIGANNGVPDAVDDTFITAPDTPLITGNVLVNDSLVDNAVVSTYDTTSVAGGTVIYNNDGTFSYNPPSGYTGTDSFTYQLIDDDGEVDTATVTINVSTATVSAPVVSSVPDTVYTENDSPSNILSGVSLSDADSATVFSVVVRIDGYIGSQDALSYLTAGTSVNASVSASGNVWELTLSDGTDINEYQSVLSTLIYQNTSDHPSSALRTITVEAYDDQFNNLFGADAGTLSIAPENDAPDVVDNAVYVLENSNDFALNITPPTDIDTDDNSLIITVTGLPTGLGGVMLADGVTPVTVGQTLSLAELSSLVFDAGSTQGVGDFTYSVSDGVETVTGTTTIDVGTTEADFNTVYESALGSGTASGSGGDTVTGNLLSNDAMSTTAIDSIDFGANNYTATSGVITIATTLGTLTVYADNSTSGYSTGDYEYVLNTTDSSGSDVDEVFTYNFTSGNNFSETLTISIIDDKPVANDLAEDIPESEENIFNVMFTLDISTSMNAQVGTTGQTRLDLAKEALAALGKEYYNQSTQVSITVLLFADGAHTLGVYDNLTDLEAAITGIRDAGTAPAYTNNSPNDNDAFITNSTSYNDALSLVEAEFTADLAGQNVVDDVQNISYFLSDGAVTSNGTPIGNGFDAFVNNNSIDSYSVGIGTGLPGNLADLNFIHNIDSLGQGNGTVDDALIIADVALLEAELLSTVPTAFGGNITVDGSITNVLFGADSGYVESITIDIGTFTYDGTNITVPSGLTGTVEINGSRITLNANDGFAYGTFTFDFSDGTYLFNAPNGTAPGSFDINYTVIDGDGDTASAVATINIVDDVPVANDDLDTLAPFEIAEGNVITGLGTDAGPAFGNGFTSFASQGGGIDKIVDNADITSFTYKGENLDLNFVTPPANGGSGNLNWTFGSEINIDGDTITQVTVTDNSDNSIFVMRSNGYYQFTPDQTGAPIDVSVDTVSQANVNAADFNITILSGGTALQYNGNGVGVRGGNGRLLSQGEEIRVAFDAVALPTGVNDLVLSISDFQVINNDQVTVIVTHDTDGDGNSTTDAVVLSATDNSGNATLDLSQFSNVTQFDISYTGTGWDTGLQNVSYQTPATAASPNGIAPVMIDYVLTDTDGQFDTARLAISTIDNTITGTTSADSIAGGSDNDAITGDDGDDALAGNAGHDVLAGGTGTDTLSGGDGNDYLSGGDDNDTLDGDAGDDHLAGDAGDDILDGGLGNDILLGGIGDDMLFGGAGNDQLDGGAGNDQLNGGAGNDTLVGGAGEDILIGGQGNDILTGGEGLDTFVWRNGDEGSTAQPAIDIINDFDDSVNGDVLDLSDLLVGEESNSLTDYLNFQFTDTDGDGDSETVINIDADGGTIFETTQQVILESVDLTEGGSLTTDQDILNNLLIKNALVVD